MISIYNPGSPTNTKISDSLKLRRSAKLFPSKVQTFEGIYGLKICLTMVPKWTGFPGNPTIFDGDPM